MAIVNSNHGELPAGFEEVIVYSDTERVWCMGEHNDHPKVYYTIPEGGQIVCMYCNIIFRMKEKD